VVAGVSAAVAIAAGLGAGFGAAAWLAWLSYKGVRALPDPRRLLPPSVRPDRATALLLAAAAAGALVWSLSGWPTAAAAAAALVVAAPRLLGVKAARRREVARQKAVAAWAEMTRDAVAAGAGLQQALIEAAVAAGAAIETEMSAFKRRAERLSLEAALERLAADLATPTADFVVAALLNATRHEARDVAALLARLAESIRDEVDMRVEINAKRAGIRTEVKGVIMVTFGTAVGVTVYASEFVEAYDTAAGQAVMALILALFAVGSYALLRLAQLPVPERFERRAPRSEPEGGRR